MFQCLFPANDLFLNMLQIMLSTPHQQACMRTIAALSETTESVACARARVCSSLQTSFTSMMKLFLTAAFFVSTANAQAGAGTVGCAEVDTDGNGESLQSVVWLPTARWLHLGWNTLAETPPRHVARRDPLASTLHVTRALRPPPLATRHTRSLQSGALTSRRSTHR